jgi:hypothetical protein
MPRRRLPAKINHEEISMAKKQAKPTQAPAPAEAPIDPGVELDEVVAEPAAAAAQPVEDAAAQESDLRRKLDEKSFSKADPRAAMWAKRSGIVDAERQELVDSDPGQARAGDAIAGAEPSAEDVDAAAAAADDAAGAPGDAQGDAPIASAAKMVKIVVDGVEREVSEDDVRNAGVAALQKLSAADARLQESATHEARVRAWAEAEEARLRAIAASIRTSPPPSATDAQAPEDVKSTIEKSLGMLVEGQQKEAAELLASVLNRRNATASPETAGRGADPNGADSQLTVQPPPVRRSKTEIEEANRVFNDEYGDLNDAAFEFTKELALANLRDPSNASRNVTDIVRAAGNKARAVFKNVTPPAPTPSAAPTPGADAQESRRQLKGRIPLAPTGASARAPAPPSEGPRLPTNKDYVAALQRRSGSNSIPR